MTITETVLGPDHPDLAGRLSNLAAILRKLGDQATAHRLLDRALAVAESAHGPDHPTTRAIRTNLTGLPW